ncbi:transglutaminase-like domain-containing protein [Sneathiella limimaris]|uniref:transglutaminase-like domain-containing protein n=1 Tax=Sneathiella limimaris TaxID=1964213 RepID=UPI00146CCA07|nr:transglutaminase family protein [Sneathiella limimaris]
MLIRIGFEMTIECPVQTPMLLALYPHPSVRPPVFGTDRIRVEPELVIENYSDVFGNRCARIEAPAGSTILWSDCVMEDSGEPDPFNWNAHQHEIRDLPSELLYYLTASRYCESDELIVKAWELFGNTPPGWERAQAISNWVHNNVVFGYRFGRPTKTAVDVFREGTGVCRDFAHLFIALCRAMNLPARYASGYLSDIGAKVEGAGDFCAWAEVFLDNKWYVFDPRHNIPRVGRILMVHGRDAADVAMITAFGDYRLTSMKVWTDEVDSARSDACIAEDLLTRPCADPLVLGDFKQHIF